MLYKCAICQETKDRILNGRYPSGQRRYIDNEGRQWKASVCPDCHKTRHRDYQREHYDLKALTVCKCLICGQEFKQRQAKQAYCGSKCRNKASNKRRKLTEAKESI